MENSAGEPFIRADGATQWIKWEARPWRDHNDKIGGIIIASEDITARTEAEAACVSSQEVNDLKAALDEHAIVAITDPRGAITYANDNSARSHNFHAPSCWAKIIASSIRAFIRRSFSRTCGGPSPAAGSGAAN